MPTTCITGSKTYIFSIIHDGLGRNPKCRQRKKVRTHCWLNILPNYVCGLPSWALALHLLSVLTPCNYVIYLAFFHQHDLCIHVKLSSAWSVYSCGAFISMICVFMWNFHQHDLLWSFHQHDLCIHVKLSLNFCSVVGGPVMKRKSVLSKRFVILKKKMHYLPSYYYFPLP